MSRRRRGFSTFACLTAAALAFSQSFLGIYAITGSVKDQVSQWLVNRERDLHGRHYTTAPAPAFLGAHPERQPEARGGVWSQDQLDEIHRLQGFGNLMAGTNLAGEFRPPYVTAMAPAAGVCFPWEGSEPSGSDSSVNTGNGNKLTEIPLLSWPCRGEILKVDFTAYHNSEGGGDLGMGEYWSNTYTIFLTSLSGNPVIHWGNGLNYPFTLSGGSYNAPAGIYDRLVKNADSTWTLTTKDKTAYTFSTSGYCTAITDRNGNAISLTLNGSNQVTKVTDPAGRYLTLNYTSGKLSSIVDPLSRTWSFTLNGSDQLTTITWPSIGDGNTYTDQFTYATGTNYIATHVDRRGKSWAATYNSNGSIATRSDPLSHTWSYSYTSSSTTITDPLSHTIVDNYSSGVRSSRKDESAYSESYTSYDSNNNVKTLIDKNGKTWQLTWDSSGNKLTETDPLSHEKVWTYNSFNEPLTYTDALSHETQWSYDSNGNCLTTTDALGHVVQTNTFDSYGELQTSKDALSNETDFTYNTNGDRVTSKDPLLNQTQIGWDGVSRLTSVTDPLTHEEQISYDNWDRPTTYTHADSTTVLNLTMPQMI